MKLPGIFSFNKKSRPFPGDVLDYDKLPFMSADELIGFTGQFNRLRNIKRIIQIDDDTYDLLYQSTLNRYFELVQLMPASQAHHHAVPAGLMIHTLEVIEHAVTLRQQYKLPQFAPQEVQEAERHVWTFAFFVAAILHDVAKRLTMCRFVLKDGSEINPFNCEAASLRGKTYRLVFIDTKYYNLHEQLGLAFIAHLLEPRALDFLLPRLHIVQEILAYIHEKDGDQGIIGKVLRLADQHSTGGSLAHSSSRRFRGANLLNIGERLMTQLRQLLAANHFVINRSNGNVYTTPQGFTYIISKTLADELRSTLREQGETDIPGDNLRIFDILQEFGFAESNPQGQIIHYIRRTYQNKTDDFSVIKFQTSKLFRVLPPEFAGQITELTEKPDKNHRSTSDDLAYAAKSVPEAVANQISGAVNRNHHAETVGDAPKTWTITGVSENNESRANSKTDAISPQNPTPGAGDEQSPFPAPVPALEGANSFADESFDDDFADNHPGIIDNVPVEKPAAEARRQNQTTGADTMPETAVSGTGEIDIPQAFLHWCREKIRAKKIVINESSGMIQKVKFGEQSVVAVVTPRAFAEFAQEVLNFSPSESREKANIQKIQSEIHKQKINIAAKRGHVHTYRIKRSESGGFNVAIKLSHYLFTIEKFSGDDDEIKEILYKTTDNTNLEKM